MKWKCILVGLISLANIVVESVAQTTTIITNLHDSLQPKITYLAKAPAPKTQLAGPPKAQTSASNIAQGQAFFTTYNSDDGLAMDPINYGHKSTICDSEGNLWFGTQGGGVSKYNGNTFVNYTTEHGLVHNSVRSITEDQSGNIWFGTFGGVAKYNGVNFITFTTEQGLAKNSVLSIAVDQSKNIWVGTDGGGVSKYDGTSFTNYTTEQGLAHNTVLCVAEDNLGNLWFGTEGGVSKYDGTSFVNYTTEHGLVHNSVRSIAEDQTGNLWFGTNEGVSKYDRTSFKSYTTENGLAHNFVSCIVEDQQGAIWFGTNKGASKYDGTSFYSYTAEQGLSHNSVRSITEDQNLNIWFGTFGGLTKYNGNSFTTYTTKQGLTNNYVLSILEDQKGSFWLGTFDGVSKYDGTSFYNYTTQHGLANEVVNSIVEDQNGTLWFGTDDGVSRYDGKSFVTYTTEQGLANNGIRSIVEDKKGNLWFGTDGHGACKYDGTSFITYNTRHGLANNHVRSIVEDHNGNLWFGTDGGGVSKYDGTSFSTYTTEHGLAKNSVLSIEVDQGGNLWFGTYGGGVSRYDGISFITYTTEDGLSDNVIMGIKETKDGSIIVGTNFGLSVLKGVTTTEIIADFKPVIDVYNQFTGYPVRDVNGGQDNGAMCYASNGVLWVGHGGNGVTRVDLSAVKKSTAAPNVVINKVSLNGEDVCWYSLGGIAKKPKLNSTDSAVLAQQEIKTYGKVLSYAERDTLQHRLAGISFDGITTFYHLPRNMALPYHHNALTFEFNAIETGRNFMVNYQFALYEGTTSNLGKATAELGGQIDWSPITKKHEATYNNLWEGEYTFLLKAQSPWGIWSNPVEFSFKVLPPWYRTWWAYTLYVLFAAFNIWLLIKMQTNRFKVRQIELEVEIDMATEEIQYQKDEVEKQKEHIEEAHKEITDSINYAERIQRSFMATREILDQNLKDYFVFFKPKDIVSGDFYWAGKLNNGNFAVVNADSTGHGVPGAIMSILNISSIEKAVEKGLIDPPEIFNETRQSIIERLNKDGSEQGGKDGMDASIVCFNADKSKIAYTAAQNPIWVIRQGEVIQIKAEKMPVGKHHYDHVPFKGGEFELQKGDKVYTLTDGFQDQFGGPKGKKFMIKKMREYVMSISHLPMQEQHQKLEEIFSNWKGDLEQVDDVCVIGVRV